MTSQGFTRDLWSMGFASHPSLYGGKDKRLFVRFDMEKILRSTDHSLTLNGAPTM